MGCQDELCVYPNWCVDESASVSLCSVLQRSFFVGSRRIGCVMKPATDVESSRGQFRSETIGYVVSGSDRRTYRRCGTKFSFDEDQKTRSVTTCMTMGKASVPGHEASNGVTGSASPTAAGAPGTAVSVGAAQSSAVGTRRVSPAMGEPLSNKQDTSSNDVKGGNGRRSGRRRAFRDAKMCDTCGKKGKKKCAKCECAIYCGVDCQKADWKHHKPECKLLRLCRETPQVHLRHSTIPPTQIGVCHTNQHGHYFFVMERKEWYHTSEPDRDVVLAQTKDLSFLGLIQCLADSILHPQYDNDLAGPRRPSSVCLHTASLGDASLTARLASIIHRLGIRIVDIDGTKENVWCSHWFCVQQGWRGELLDAHFLSSIPPRRRVPLEPNGQARKNQAPIAQDDGVDAPNDHTVLTNLNPADFPTRDEALSLPPDTSRNTRGLWIVAKDVHLFICYHGPDGFSLRLHQTVPLQHANRRPFPQDVLLCIYQVLVDDLGVRPVGAWLGQPSICSHNDVEVYEQELDGTILQGNLTLGAMNSMEGQLEGMLPHFREAGIFDEDQEDVSDDEFDDDEGEDELENGHGQNRMERVNSGDGDRHNGIPGGAGGNGMIGDGRNPGIGAGGVV